MEVTRHHPPSLDREKGEGIVYAPRNRGLRDERTGLNEPLVYRLWHQLNCRVAKFGRDKR